MIGLVPAAGEGTRLRPLTADTPKGMVDLNGRPLLAAVFETLVACGVDELVVVVGYELSAIVEAFGETFEDVPITYVHQREQLGLGHAVLQAAPLLDEQTVVLNGDNVFATPPTWIGDVDLQAGAGSDAIVVVEAGTRDVARTTGVVDVVPTRLDGPEGVARVHGDVAAIEEKPEEPASTLVTTGCYVLPPAITDALSLLSPSDRGEYELTDAVDVLRRAGSTVLAVETPGERVNVNTQADLDAARTLDGN
jgi:glucose-1-phosphate thymidylyltransferase